MKIKSLLYCCKEKNKGDRLMISCKGEYKLAKDFLYITDYPKIYNGNIVCECEVETEEIFIHATDVGVGFDYYYYLENDNDLKGSCLTQFDLQNYLGTINASGEKVGYALHLSNVKVFDKPRELEECEKTNVKLDFTDTYVDDNYYELTRVFKAPQNMMWVRDMKDYERKVLISIRPEWLCLILNGKKDIEVRRKVLKGMVE